MSRTATILSINPFTRSLAKQFHLVRQPNTKKCLLPLCLSSSLCLSRYESFPYRHIGPRPQEQDDMLKSLGLGSLDQLADKVIPDKVRQLGSQVMSIMLENIPPAVTESDLSKLQREYGRKNKLLRSYIGQGYYGTHTVPAIQRNLVENPAWHTQYTPYQAEISQGRLESLLNFQTMISELTGLPIANSSLLDEGTAAAEAMLMLYAHSSKTKNQFLVDQNIFDQTLACLYTRAEPLGIEIKMHQNLENLMHQEIDLTRVFGILVQNPGSNGRIADFTPLANLAHSNGISNIMIADVLSLVLITPPGEMGFDVAVGSTQRFGIPMGYGGPHAAYFACNNQFKRLIPGRLVGISRDQQGKQALRLALQTREQHIKREKATSNICTAQALLANAAAMYVIYHGIEGLEWIARKINMQALWLANCIKADARFNLVESLFFDTICIDVGKQYNDATNIIKAAADKGINLGITSEGRVRLSLDETVKDADLHDLLEVLGIKGSTFIWKEAEQLYLERENFGIPSRLLRQSKLLQQHVFKNIRSELQLVRYIYQLQAKDMSLIHSMIPLGSCTMKLTGSSELNQISDPNWCQLHPFVPKEQAQGYVEMMDELEHYLAAITGFDAISLQPNSGAQGEYAGLRIIRAYHKSQEERGSTKRNVCLIPVSAHGTNPASAAISGYSTIIGVKCTANGTIDQADLDAKLATYGHQVGAVMITYPSTFGKFDQEILEICNKVHQVGGLVYLDGANLNAMVGLVRPRDLGADVCHVNLHKTFCIPHGGGGPGVGPIGVVDKLKRFLPSHPFLEQPALTTHLDSELGSNKKDKVLPFTVAASPFGSASILGISWSYIRLMGPQGLRKASLVALLNANYLANQLSPYYSILYLNENGLCAHEFIIDLRPFERAVGISAADIAKRLLDYSIHSPTMSWPVPGTLMIEPTESEDKRELDRFIQAMISIRTEISNLEQQQKSLSNSTVADSKNLYPRYHNNQLIIDYINLLAIRSILKMAPHTLADLVDPDWEKERNYSREQAVFPLPFLRQAKFWPTVNRLDDAFGDLNLICTSPKVESE